MKKIVTLFAVILISAFAYAQNSAEKAAAESTKTKEELLEVLPTDTVIGSDDALITIIEYASMTCSHCSAFHNNTFADLKTKYIDTGKVRFIFRDFPLDEPALRASMMARCAAKGDDGKENFIKFNKIMFSTQSNWAPKKNYLEILSNIGKLGGMTGEEFDQCIADEDLQASIMQSKFDAAKTLEVRSTPTFFINGEMHKGARDLEYFSNVIDEFLNVGNEVIPE